MPAFSSKGKVQDDVQIKRESGGYFAKISKIETRKSMSGKKEDYLSLTLTLTPPEGEGTTFEVFDKLLISSEAEYPQTYIKRYLTALGFYRAEADEHYIEEWSMMKTLGFYVIIRKEEEWNSDKGKMTEYFKVHSMYNMQYLSPGEIMEGKTEALKFADDLQWVKDNPIKKLKGGAPTESAGKKAQGNGDAF